MSGGYGPPVVNTFGMITGLGKAFDDAYDAGVKARQEREAPALISQLMGVQAGGAAPSTLGTMAQSYQNGGKLPSFASAAGGAGDYLRTVSGIESGGADTARNPNSTATGRYQFTQDTWNGLAKKYPDLGLTPNGRTDPGQQDRAMEAFTRDNANALSKAGVPVTPGNLYVSHFLGEAGGPRFIAGAMSNPDAPATQFVTPGAAAANRSIFFNRDGSPKSAAEVYAERTGRFPGGSAPTPALPTQVAGGGPAMTMPSASAQPTMTAQADPDAANKPAPGMQPAGFVIPGQDAAPAQPAPQGFAGFGAPASRITPAQQEVLTAAWKNPVTRPMATALTGSVERGFAALTSDVKARSTINWQPIAILLGVLGSLGTMGFTWINTGQGRLELAIAKVETASQRYVPREDLDARFAVLSQRRDDLQRLTDSRIERMERDVDSVGKQVVPRGEHEQMWAAQRARDADLQRQADQNRQGLYDLNTPRDTIQGMQRRIDELEKRGSR